MTSSGQEGLRPPVPFESEYDAVLRQTLIASLNYLRAIQTRPVQPTEVALRDLVRLDPDLPNTGLAAEDVINLLDKVGSPATVTTAGGRFFGFVMGGSLPAATAANWLAAAWDQVATSVTASPVAASLEATCLRWLLELLGLPRESAGAFVTGATMANFACLAAARRSVLQRLGWDVDSDGLRGAPPFTVLASEEAHPSVLKSLALLGLGRDQVVSMETDSQGRVFPHSLPASSGPAIVCLQAGNVNSGSIDPIGAICTQHNRPNWWVHVDGAFGLWAAACPPLAEMMVGVDQADSWAVDAHKWLNVPYDSGIAFVRDGDQLKRSMAVAASYLAVDQGRQPKDYTPELSRRARGVDIWAAILSLGRIGVASLIERSCRQARRFADGLERAGFEVLNEVSLNQVLVSFGPDEATSRVIKRIQEEGTCWCGGTVWRGRGAMRISVTSWATTDEDVELSLAAMVRCAQAEER